jgi:hypothetical protein
MSQQINLVFVDELVYEHYRAEWDTLEQSGRGDIPLAEPAPSWRILGGLSWVAGRGDKKGLGFDIWMGSDATGNTVRVHAKA